MQNYILDTNLFFNMEGHLGIGETTEKIIRNLTVAMGKTKDTHSYLIPPTVADEIKTFFDNPEEDFLLDFFKMATIKSPSLTELTISAKTMSDFIDESRERSYRGMKVGEEEMISTGNLFMGKEVLPHKEYQITIGKVIKTFRDRYRNATRTGFLDSKADFELIMLAKETDGYLISTDVGVIKWGRIMGVKEMDSSAFGKMIQEYL
jgi:RNA ligase partner protein